MEETVWIIIGIISFILVIGILASFAVKKADDDRHTAVRQGLDSMLSMCNSVCNMPQGTYLRTTAQFPSGVLLESSSRSICAELDGERQCRFCPCTVEDKTILNLTSEEAREFFFIHTYNCFFERGAEELGIDCRG